MREDKKYVLEPFQSKFLLSDKRYPAMISAWGTGKSLCGIGRAMRFSNEYSNNLGVIFRREFTDLRDSTVKDFENYTGMTVGSSRDVKMSNGSVIMFRHLEELRNLQNMNLGWFWIEQVEELDSEEQFFILFGRLRREGCKQSGYVTGNTNGHNWVYKLWKLNNLEDSELIEATTFDNQKHLPEEFLKSLEIVKKRKPLIYNRFVMNSWDELNVQDVIIRPDWVKKASERTIPVRSPFKRVVSIDVARYGDDKTVLYAIENYRVLGKEEYEKKSTMETVGLAMMFAEKFKIPTFAVDEIGIGSGVVDRLLELGKDVIAVNSSAKSSYPDKYYNLRSEIYCTGADLFESDRVQIPFDDYDLMEQLSWAKYKSVKSSGLIQIESKEDIKKRYGRSTDNSDPFLNGLWAMERVKELNFDGIEVENRRVFIPDRFKYRR